MRLPLMTIIVLVFTPVTANWWVIGSQVMTDPDLICRKTKRFRGRLESVCRGKKPMMGLVKTGIELGWNECVYQFRHGRWNCSTDRKILKRILLRDTKESGFIHSITSAGVTFSITRGCSSGDILDCSCTKDERKNIRTAKKWMVHGCDTDNVQFGAKIARAFLDHPYRKRTDMKNKIRLHNNNAGRLAIKKLMYTECKCHGLSGSCTLKTCWRKMPHLRNVGDLLRQRFNRAVLVVPRNDGRGEQFMTEANVKLQKIDLVYSETSDFCRANKKIGSLGTTGRECNVTSVDEDRCDFLCCGRGFNTQIIRESSNCRCRFHWCCRVDCEICERNRTVSYCY